MRQMIVMIPVLIILTASSLITTAYYHSVTSQRPSDRQPDVSAKAEKKRWWLVVS